MMNKNVENEFSKTFCILRNWKIELISLGVAGWIPDTWTAYPSHQTHWRYFQVDCYSSTRTLLLLSRFYRLVRKWWVVGCFSVHKTSLTNWNTWRTSSILIDEACESLLSFLLAWLIEGHSLEIMDQNSS
jgi:hypothetical protein